jgi:tetratricopeptide (TPR) repeat protein
MTLVFAISNSLARWLMLSILLAWMGVSTARAEALKIFATRADKIFIAARAAMRAAPTNSEAAWKFGSACFDHGEYATNDTQRATLAVEGINAMRELIAREPKLAAGHYYLAMNLGQLARTKTLGALPLVDQMEVEFKAAHDCDEKWDFAGPDRNLGELYFQAPGWPASIGSRFKARKHLERAVELAPDYPENHLNLLEACLKWDDAKGMRREVVAIKKLWSAAQTNFTGEAWQSNWADWNSRRDQLEPRARKFLQTD